MNYRVVNFFAFGARLPIAATQRILAAVPCLSGRGPRPLLASLFVRTVLEFPGRLIRRASLLD